MSAVGLRPVGNELPPLYGDRRSWALIQTDALGLLPELPAHSVDAVVTDPPYGLAFKDAAWDGSDLRAVVAEDIPSEAHGWAMERFVTGWAAEVLRVLKPGGHLLAFGAPRTVHRLASGLEEAGFELRDQLMWLFGQGLPKSRAWPDGRGTTLKPAYEPIVLARAPFAGRADDNVARWGTGALEIAAARVSDDGRPGDPGRWPADVVLSHDAECRPPWACTERCPAQLLDEQAPAAGPSRFFYCAKATPAEKEAGCQDLPAEPMQVFNGRGRARLARNTHPTVKPLALMRWLVRLVTPPGGLVLDPFAGSGSTLIAAMHEGRSGLGIEREPEYTAIARARLAH